MHQGGFKLINKLSVTSKHSKIKTSMICNGFGCSRPSIYKITQSIGKFGKIELDLCPECIRIFEHKSTEA